MYGAKIIVRDIPIMEPRTGRKKQSENHQTKAAGRGFSMPHATNAQETVVSDPLLNGVFVQLGISTNTWLIMRTMANGN